MALRTLCGGSVHPEGNWQTDGLSTCIRLVGASEEELGSMGRSRTRALAGKDPKGFYQPDQKNVGQQRVKRRTLRLSSLAHCLPGDSTMTSEDSRRSTLWVASSTKLLRPNTGV